ncbi:hypothetical protein [Hippea jasoniae]|uniref:hypothetical protein n=1 Tax=Hippea jasoniae TaxID=944479 RepID=UPI000A8B747C|nr:hypothetical protein [Hippea jasoniae]
MLIRFLWKTVYFVLLLTGYTFVVIFYLFINFGDIAGSYYGGMFNNLGESFDSGMRSFFDDNNSYF